jgi:hypothetical protein
MMDFEVRTMSQTLSQSEVRNQFAEVTQALRRRQYTEVHFGKRGKDEITMLPSDDLRELKRLAQKGAATEAAARAESADPWADMKTALRSDPASFRPVDPRRRLDADFDPTVPDVSAPAWDEMVRRAVASRRVRSAPGGRDG